MMSSYLNEASKTEEKPTADMQLRRLTLFSSGVGFFEHSGNIAGSAEFVLPFNQNAVNDALKSIVINDPDASPTVSYHSEDTLLRTMKGLSIDLHSNHHIAELLSSLKGAEIEVFTPKPIKGRILLVEFRGERYGSYDDALMEATAFLSLFTAEGIRIISLKEISGFAFTDPKINTDANRALDLILQSRESDIRNLTVRLPGQKERKVSLSYVIPTPIWKVSYRLDLSREIPFLQGWAIVDNDSDMDWAQVELALVTGKPVSFIQNLYVPYHLSRPTLPLAIAGIAEAQTYESGTPLMNKTRRTAKRMSEFSLGESNMLRQSEVDSLLCSLSSGESEDEEETELSVEDLLASATLAEDGAFDTASGCVAGDQFEFTIKHPVSLPRQQSAMLPLVNSAVEAMKMLVFSGHRAAPHQLTNPAIGVALVNNSGMKLPAGPITVYDGGTYAGDALIAFFPEDEKRIISYGEDLSVTGHYTASTSRVISAVSIKNGMMLIKTKVLVERVYTFNNASGEEKRLIVEHPFKSNRAVLVTPVDYMEKTSALYRFELILPTGESSLKVQEEELIAREIELLSDSRKMYFAEYAANPEFPEKVQVGISHAISLWQHIHVEDEKLNDLKNQLTRLFKEQERTRKNLEAAGSQTQQGQNYLSRLAAQDNHIDEINAAITNAEQAKKAAQQEYDEYIREMYFEEQPVC